MTEPSLISIPKWLPYPQQPLSTTEAVQLIRINIERISNTIKYQNILSEEEYQKANRFVHQKDKQRYILSRYYLRCILSGILDINPQSIEFYLTGNKKPSVEGVYFNMSHSKDYIVIAVSSKPLGVDIEYIDQEFDYRAIMLSYFNSAEISFIESGMFPVLNFYTIWTRKEALLKATGEGLVDRLDLVPCMTPYSHRGSQNFHTETYSTADRYLISLSYCNQQKQFWQIRN